MTEPATVIGPYSGRFFTVEAAGHTYRYVENDSLTEGQWAEEFQGRLFGTPNWPPEEVKALLNYILESFNSTTDEGE